MNGSGLDTEARIAAIKKAYTALNLGDVPGFLSLLDPEVERVEPSGFPLSGTYRGIEAVRPHVEQARASWAEGACEPERFVAAGDHIIAIVQVKVRLRSESDWREGRVADLFTFRGDKVVHFQTFTSLDEALHTIQAGGAG
ncbi:MAG TPA: nuclear transport factor 2 family protein [Phycisphaerales bacterium]|nr:nuclear transport factor 2 family protein [Phycisphaerales bacterium]